MTTRRIVPRLRKPVPSNGRTDARDGQAVMGTSLLPLAPQLAPRE